MLSLMITLCMYAQQDYAFGIVCVYVAKKLAVEVLPIENLSLVQATARPSSLIAKKRAYYARRFVQRKKFGNILLTGREKGSRKIVFW